MQEAACSAMSVMEEEFGYGMQAYLDPIVRCVLPCLIRFFVCLHVCMCASRSERFFLFLFFRSSVLLLFFFFFAESFVFVVLAEQSLHVCSRCRSYQREVLRELSRFTLLLVLCVFNVHAVCFTPAVKCTSTYFVSVRTIRYAAF